VRVASAVTVQAPHGYHLFKNKLDHCEKVILKPDQGVPTDSAQPNCV
jgi:hypothetical protein